MKTLTDKEFKSVYGDAALSQLNKAVQTNDTQTGFFNSLKNDLAQRGQNNANIYNQSISAGDTSLGNSIEGGMKLAANTAGGLGDVAGEALKRIPIVGGVLNAAGNAIKSGFNTVTNKLADTNFFKEAAAGSSPTSPVEKGLSVASSGGEVAGNILGADQGAGMLNASKDIAATVPSRVSSAVDSIPKPTIQGAYNTASDLVNRLPSAVQDVIPTAQNTIDHQLTKALDLTAGDLGKIEAKTGNQAAKWLSDYDLIKTNKATTQAAIDAFKTQNYNAVRSEIGKVGKFYTEEQIPRFKQALGILKNNINKVPGLEQENVAVDNLLKKNLISLEDVQKVKELLDDHFNLYNALGDVAENTTKQGLAKIRNDLQVFIEDKVKEYTGADIRMLNNNVSTARSISDAITKRSPKGLTSANLTTRDVMMTMGLTYFGSPIVGIAALLVKKLVTSPTARLRFARWLDQKGDAYRAQLSEALQKGKVPPEAQKVIDATSPTGESSQAPSI